MSDSFVTPWTVTHQDPLSLGFSRQEYWSGLPFPSPGGLPHPGIEPLSPALAGGFFTTEQPGKYTCIYPHAIKKHVKSLAGKVKVEISFFFFSFIFISWRLITLQYCSGFCHTLT